MEPIICKDYKDTRSGFGQGLLEAGRENPSVFALCADLIGSLKMADFIKEFPERFIQTGIAEANMIGIAAGLALSGKIPSQADLPALCLEEFMIRFVSRWCIPI